MECIRCQSPIKTTQGAKPLNQNINKRYKDLCFICINKEKEIPYETKYRKICPKCKDGYIRRLTIFGVQSHKFEKQCSACDERDRLEKQRKKDFYRKQHEQDLKNLERMGYRIIEKYIPSKPKKTYALNVMKGKK